ncbi:hypothetical protein F53441_1242 [Fusarium austroafricanum]|uniref:N,N-dimethylformamidase beta subunit-like C-terminal domain-containing protein n=1 Tax=Fusarium austroafricanum TaxID=2364996 RepID=A0A8H4KV21_9HYPO|nr:hypothetical protein F53441_1242 [Fusarium austroafricanum]
MPSAKQQYKRPLTAWGRPGGLVERPGTYPDKPEIWVYCDKFSYDPKENSRVSVKVHTTEATFDLEVIRDGHKPETVSLQRDIFGTIQDTPEEPYRVGCSWQESVSLDISSYSPGFYLVIARTIAPGLRHPVEAEGFFIVKSPQRGAADAKSQADFVLIHTTSTIMAYNDWGGANHYRGVVDDAYNETLSPVVSRDRPLARGMLRLPQGAPREGNGSWIPSPGEPPRYPALEWSYMHGYSRHFADAGYATYERPFLVWAEAEGYKVHHLTQHDLHHDHDCLGGYKCAVIVGHDEYWTWEMRDAIDAFVDNGGRLARFAGNYAWQVRFEQNGEQQICYKDASQDPLYGKNDQRVSTLWDWGPIKRPGAQTMGLTATMGGYTCYGSATPRWSGGFQVFRPKHWALKGSHLHYGDLFGSEAKIASFEVDGADYNMRKGLPYPTGQDGAPMTLEIIATCPGTSGEEDQWDGEHLLNADVREVMEILEALHEGTEMPEFLKDREYTSGVVASFTRNKGEVFVAGTCEWVNGLIKTDFFVETITRNVLNKFISS